MLPAMDREATRDGRTSEHAGGGEVAAGGKRTRVEAAYPTLARALRPAAEGAPTIHDAATAAVDHKGSGAAVEPGIAAQVGGYLGADLGGVRVHSDPMAHEASAAMGARAFAHGDDVFLGAGERGTDLGLMAHELTHVVQQGAAGRRTVARKVEVGDADSPAEREADAVASAVTAGAAPSAWLVDDGPVAPGQMLKSTFIAQLRGAVTEAADRELGPIYSALGCPYIDQYFGRYADRPAAEGEALLRRFAPGVRGATSAAAMIPVIVARVADGVRHWRDTGQPPPEVAAFEPGPVASPEPAPTGDVGGAAAWRDPDGGGSLASLEAELGNGVPLDGGTAGRMAAALGGSYEQVRLHRGPVAARKADEADAVAFTVGNHVVLGSAAPPAGTVLGDALLAHELAHVDQQAVAASDPVARRQPIGGESAAAEDQADVAAVAAVEQLHAGKDGVARSMTGWRTGLTLQRCSKGQGAKASAQFAGAHAQPAGTVKHLAGAEVDALLAKSALLGPYIKSKRDAGVKADGRVFFYSSADFVEAWVKYAVTKQNPATGAVFTEAEARAWVPRAFTADDGGMHIDENAGEPRTAIHESIHFYQSDAFKALGFEISEGFTEYFAQALITEQKVPAAGTNPALADRWDAAKRVIAATSVDAAAKAYFSGDINALKSAVDAAKGAGTFDKWKGYLNQNPPDYAAANALF